MVSGRLAADVEILRDRQIREDAPVLGHEAQPPPRDLERLEVGDVLAEEADRSAALWDHRHQCLERRRFAGAIATHERDHLAAADVEGELEQDLRCAEVVALMGRNGAGKSTTFKALMAMI